MSPQLASTLIESQVAADIRMSKEELIDIGRRLKPGVKFLNELIEKVNNNATLEELESQVKRLYLLLQPFDEPFKTYPFLNSSDSNSLDTSNILRLPQSERDAKDNNFLSPSSVKNFLHINSLNPLKTSNEKDKSQCIIINLRTETPDNAMRPETATVFNKSKSKQGFPSPNSTFPQDSELNHSFSFPALIKRKPDESICAKKKFLHAEKNVKLLLSKAEISISSIEEKTNNMKERSEKPSEKAEGEKETFLDFVGNSESEHSVAQNSTIPNSLKKNQSNHDNTECSTFNYYPETLKIYKGNKRSTINTDIEEKKECYRNIEKFPSANRSQNTNSARSNQLKPQDSVLLGCLEKEQKSPKSEKIKKGHNFSLQQQNTTYRDLKSPSLQLGKDIPVLDFKIAKLQAGLHQTSNTFSEKSTCKEMSAVEKSQLKCSIFPKAPDIKENLIPDVHIIEKAFSGCKDMDSSRLYALENSTDKGKRSGTMHQIQCSSSGERSPSPKNFKHLASENISTGLCVPSKIESTRYKDSNPANTGSHQNRCLSTKLIPGVKKRPLSPEKVKNDSPKLHHEPEHSPGHHGCSNTFKSTSNARIHLSPITKRKNYMKRLRTSIKVITSTNSLSPGKRERENLENQSHPVKHGVMPPQKSSKVQRIPLTGPLKTGELSPEKFKKENTGHIPHSGNIDLKSTEHSGSILAQRNDFRQIHLPPKEHIGTVNRKTRLLEKWDATGKIIQAMKSMVTFDTRSIFGECADVHVGEIFRVVRDLK